MRTTSLYWKTIIAIVVLVAVLFVGLFVSITIDSNRPYTLDGDTPVNGTVEGYGSYSPYSYAKLIAKPDPGYRLEGWYDEHGYREGSVFGDDLTLSVWMYKNRHITAKFVLKTILVRANSEGADLQFEWGGDPPANEDGEYAVGAKITIKPIMVYGYEFVKWIYDGNEYPNQTMELTVPDVEYMRPLKCVVKGIPCDVTVVAGDSNVTSVTEGGTHPYGSTIELSAETVEWYTIGKWKEGDKTVASNKKSISYKVTGTVTITAFSAVDLNSEFTAEQTKYEGTFEFKCTDNPSPLASDVWSAEGTDDTGTKHALNCTYSESPKGAWVVKVTYGSLQQEKIRKVSISHTSSAGGESSTSSKSMEAYHWTYVSPSYSVRYFGIFMELDRGKFSSELSFANDWNRSYEASYRSSTKWNGILKKDADVERIALIIKDVLMPGAGAKEKVQCALSFVQYTVDYKFDSENYLRDEYFATAYMTLYKRAGDCEDTSILTMTLAHYLGHRIYFISPPGHMVAGVVIGNSGGNFDNYPGLFFCETTAIGYKVGDVPDEYLNKNCDIVRAYII